MTPTEFRPAMGRDANSAQDPKGKDPTFDLALRPERLADFVGQRAAVENLKTAIDAARLRGEALDHVLLSGLPGLGKTSLAEILSRELGVGFRATSGPVIERPGDLAGLLTVLQRGDVLFIDEIHRLPTQVEEYLYSAMEDFKLVIMLDQGPRSRAVPIQIQPFTLVGATTREGLLSDPFRARFGIHERLEPYPIDDLVTIALSSARKLGLHLERDGAFAIADRARGTPRLVNRYLRRVRDLAQVQRATSITKDLALDALQKLGLDSHGLTSVDRQILDLLNRAGDQPIGLKTISVALGEEERTIEDVYEPFLIREGFVAKTSRGRVLTATGRELVREQGSRPNGNATTGT